LIPLIWTAQWRALLMPFGLIKARLDILEVCLLLSFQHAQA